MKFEFKKEQIAYIQCLGNRIEIVFKPDALDVDYVAFHYTNASRANVMLDEFIDVFGLVETDRQGQYIVKK